MDRYPVFMGEAIWRTTTDMNTNRTPKLLLQTTIPRTQEDWDITRFTLLTEELRSAGCDVTARNRSGAAEDPFLSRIDELDVDQLWLMAVDTGHGLTAAEAAAIGRFRARGGGVLTARDHQDLGSCLLSLGSLGAVNRFHDPTVDPAAMRDDVDSPDISWPNFHSGSNGDYQPVVVNGSVHELLRTTQTASGRIEWFPAHPHEGLVVPHGPFSTVVAQGRSSVTGRLFNLAIAIDGETAPDGAPLGRAVAHSTFHHFADYNWNVHCGAPAFVTEPPGTEIVRDPTRLKTFKVYVRNLVRWLEIADRKIADAGATCSAVGRTPA
jgi:hypothetical protein